MIKDVGTDLERLMLDTNAIYQYDFSKDKELSEVNKDLEEIIDIAMKMSTTQRLLLFQSMVRTVFALWKIVRIFLLEGKRY